MIASKNLLVLIFYIHVALAHILPRPTSSYPIENKTISSSPIITSSRSNAHTFNGTIVSTVSPTIENIEISLCPFVVQDTINIQYWPSYDGQELNSNPFNITSIVTAVTQYIDTIITRYTTNVIVTSTRTSVSWELWDSPPQPAPNKAQSLERSVLELKYDADLTSGNSTFSPSGTTFIYPTARIITVPAVTQDNGRLACTTAITRRYFYNEDDLEAGRNPCGMRVFTGMNSNVQRYYDSSRFSLSPDQYSTKIVGPAINLPTQAQSGVSIPDVTSASLTTETFYSLSFATPFAHEPSWNVTNLDDYGGYNFSTGMQCPGVFEHGIADYGYVPQAFIEFITQEFPEITSRFPPGATLLPGGPSIIDGIAQLQAAPASVGSAEDLTVSTAFTVRNTGCFHPELCLPNDDAPAIVAITTVSTTQSLVQNPNSPEATATQASKTTFLASLANTHRETSVLKSSAVASTSSVANSAESAQAAGDAPITTKAAALPSQSAWSVASQISESNLLLGFERIVQSFAAYLLASIGPSQLTSTAAPKNILDSQTISSATGSPIAVYKTTSGSAPQVSELVVNHGRTSKLPAHPEPVIKTGSKYLTSHAVLEDTMDRKTPVAGSTPIVVSRATHSLAAHVSALIVNGVTSPLLTNLQATTFPEVKTRSQYLTPGPRLGYILGSIILIPGASPTVFSGTTYSLAPEASILVANGVTSILQEQKTLPTSLPKSTPTGSGRLKYIFAGQTLGPDMPTITVSGLVISLAALGNTVVIDGTPFPFPTGTIPSLTIGSQLPIASDLFMSDQVIQVGSAARTTSDGNARNTTSVTNVTTIKTNRLLSTLPTSITGEGVPPVSGFTGRASGEGYGFPQMLRLSLVVLGLILLQAS